MLGHVIYRVWCGRSENDIDRMSAAMSYYAMLALAPLIALVGITASRFIDPEIVQKAIYAWLLHSVGPQSAATVSAAATSYAERATGSTTLTIIAVALMLWGAIGLFRQVVWALHRIWDRPQVVGFHREVRLQLIALAAVGFVVVTFIGALTIFTLIAGVGFMSWSKWVALLVSTVVVALAFAAAYHFMSGGAPTWSDALLGASLAALAYTIGSYILGAFVGSSFTVSAYGAAGSVLATLIWVYFAANVFLEGADIARVVAEERLSRQVPPLVRPPD